jgi:hypothetical protein
LTARYDVLVAGLLVGKATVTGTIDEKSYKMSLNANVTGLVGALAGGKGSATSSGALANNRVLSNGYALRASNGKLSRVIQIGMSRGDVSKVVVTPPFAEAADRVPVTAAHKQDVSDPLAALLMPMSHSNPMNKANCSRTIRVFDGAQRFDVKMAYAGTENVNIKGYSGPVLVCSARYTPLGGHFPKRPATQFMVNNRELSTWIAPIAGSNVLAPVRINVKTQVGLVAIVAKQFPGAAANDTPTASTGQ